MLLAQKEHPCHITFLNKIYRVTMINLNRPTSLSLIIFLKSYYSLYDLSINIRGDFWLEETFLFLDKCIYSLSLYLTLNRSMDLYDINCLYK